MTRALPLALLAALTLSAGSLRAQSADVRGVVVDGATAAGVADAILRVEGTDLSAASDAEGRFTLRSVPVGAWTLVVSHIGYGTHRHPLRVEGEEPVAVRLLLTAQAIALEPLVVETRTARDRRERGQGFSLNVVERAQIEEALGTSRHMGDLIQRTIPGISLRQTSNLPGTNVCLEFRGAATISLLAGPQSCAHPMVLLDGVVVNDPNFLYGTIGLSNIERIQVIPPAEAGARYGTGSLYGVILIDTRPPGRTRLADDRYLPFEGVPGRTTFDWDADPAGHPLGRSAAGAVVGNLVGLAAGLALGGRCIGVDAQSEIETRCGRIGNAAAVGAAVALPALGAAFGARLGGGTDLSVGRTAPALLAATMMLFPGYAFSMSTVGGGSEAANAVGNTLLVVGVPVVVTLADRLFRSLRAGS